MIELLIADDEQWVREGVAKTIDWASLGIVVSGTAEDGKVAYNLITKTGPDIVLMDIKMPGMSGLQVIEAIQSEQIVNPTFVIITGHADFMYARQALQLSVEDYILKPFSPSNIQECVGKIANEIRLKTMNFILKQHQLSLVRDADKPLLYPQKEEHRLMLGLLARDKESSLGALDEFFAKCALENSFEDVLLCFSILYAQILKFLMSRRRTFPHYQLLDGKKDRIDLLYSFFCSIICDACGPGVAQANPTVLRAVEYIEEYYSYEDLTLEKVAAACFISPAYLSSLFTQTLGVSYIEYLNNTRMAHAKTLLSDHSLRLKDVARMVGFRSVKYFHRVFKGATGTTPSKFREELY